jgi:hypothetical protein
MALTAGSKSHSGCRMAERDPHGPHLYPRRQRSDDSTRIDRFPLRGGCEIVVCAEGLSRLHGRTIP